MNTLPTIKTYGQYNSGNYGVNSLMVSFPTGLTLYFSYQTIIAFVGHDGEQRTRQNEWSTTTGKHLNWVCPNKNERIDGVSFEKELKAELAFYGLSEK